MTINKQVMLDSSREQLNNFIARLKQENGLTFPDIENILYQVIADIKSEKEIEYSNTILNLAYQVQQLEEEKKKMLQEKEIQTTTEKEK